MQLSEPVINANGDGGVEMEWGGSDWRCTFEIQGDLRSICIFGVNNETGESWDFEIPIAEAKP